MPENLLGPDDIDEAAASFHRDGFIMIKNVLSPEQVDFLNQGMDAVTQEMLQADPERKGNRGSLRYSIANQIHRPQWQQLIDVPAVIKILTKIWDNDDFTCMGLGGDFCLPGCEYQPLHSDMEDFTRLHTPLNLIHFRDLPCPFVVVNFLCCDFTLENGPTRFIPFSHRSRAKIPTLEREPHWMKNMVFTAPKGTALIRDLRTWHGGTPNRSQHLRAMASCGYYAPWFRGVKYNPLSPDIYNTLDDFKQKLCREMLTP